MTPRWRWARLRGRPPSRPDAENGRTGPPDTTRQRGGEARPTANTEPQDSPVNANSAEPCCRRHSRCHACWSHVLAEIGVLIGGVGQVLPDDAWQHSLEVLVNMLT